jgi:hypothetical protein
MAQPCGVLWASVISLLWGLAFPTIVWAHHPIPRPEANGEWPWFLPLLLGAGVFGVVFVATWVVFSFIERRQRSESGEREAPGRS